MCDRYPFIQLGQVEGGDNCLQIHNLLAEKAGRYWLTFLFMSELYIF